MPLFDALQNISQGAPQPDLGGTLTQQLPGMGPPASQAEFNQRKQGWSQALQDPALMSGLFQFGLALMSPGPVGQTGTGHVANALGRGANAVTTTQQLQQKNQLAQQEEARKTRSSDAQANLAEAYTRKADSEQATAPLKARRETEQHELNIKRLNVQIKTLEAQGRKAEADIVRAELDAAEKPAKDQAELDYKKALTAESQARASNLKTNTNVVKNSWSKTVSKMADGQTMVSMYNKATGESKEYILTRMTPEQIDNALFEAGQQAKMRGETLSKEETEKMRAEMMTPKVEEVPRPAGSAPAIGIGGGEDNPGDAEHLSSAEARALGIEPMAVAQAGGPASPAKPSQGQERKADFIVKPGRVLLPDGQVFQPTTAGQDFKERLKRRKAELREWSIMRNNATGEDKERLTKKVQGLMRDFQRDFGSKEAMRANK